MTHQRPLVPEDLRRDPGALARAAAASVTRTALCHARAALSGSPILPIDVARRDFDDPTLNLVLRAASSPATITNTPALAQVAVAFLATLQPMSAGADLFGRAIQLSFDGSAAINLPALSLPAPAFVGEGRPIAVQQATTAPGPTLSPHKLATIVALTGEILRSSNAEILVREALVASVGPSLDAALFSANAASADAPPGLLYNITPLTPASAGQSKSEIIVDDIQKIASALGPVSGNGNLVLIAAPDAAAALVLRLPQSVQWPVLMTAALAPQTVIALAVNGLVSATGGPPEIEAKQDVEVVMADPGSEAVDIGGVVGQPIMSTFQTNSVSLRLKWRISWALRDPRAVAWLQSVNW